MDFPARVIDWAALLDESQAWPPDQRLLVRSAYEMAFDTPGEVTRAMTDPVTLSDVVRHLDDDEVERIPGRHADPARPGWSPRTASPPCPEVSPGGRAAAAGQLLVTSRGSPGPGCTLRTVHLRYIACS